MPDRVTWSDLRGQRSGGHSARPDWDQAGIKVYLANIRIRVCQCPINLDCS